MQKFFGNIVTTGKPDVDRSLFNVVPSIDMAVNGIPTLIIGLENARSAIDRFTILEKNYGLTSWTYSKTERRCDYEDDLDLFIEQSIKSGLNNIKYTYLDLMNYGFSTVRRLIGFAKGNTKKIVFLTKGSSFMFIYCEEYNTVFGFSLSLCEYLGIQKKKVYRMLKNAEYVHDTSFIGTTLRKVIGNETHYIPILYSIIMK